MKLYYKSVVFVKTTKQGESGKVFKAFKRGIERADCSGAKTGNRATARKDTKIKEKGR